MALHRVPALGLKLPIRWICAEPLSAMEIDGATSLPATICETTR